VSAKNIGVHKLIPEYASTTSISATPRISYSWCSHFHPIQRKFEVCFLLKYFQKSLSHPRIKRQSKKKRDEQREKNRRAPKVSHEERDAIFIEEKNISTSNLFV
jgi:hypothetical protein